MRAKITLLVAGLLLGVLATRILWPARETTRAAHESVPSAPVGTRAEAPDAAPNDATEGEGLLVVMPEEFAGLLPVAFADTSAVRAVKTVTPNRRVPLREDLLPDGLTVVAPVDDLSRSPLLARVHAELEWPRPVTVFDRDATREVRFEFRRAEVRRGIVAVAETETGEPCPGIAFRIEAVHDTTSAELPVAFLKSDERGRARGPNLAPGRYRVALQGHANEFRPVSRAPVEVTLRDPGDLEVRFAFSAFGALRGQLQLTPPKWWSVAVYQLPVARRPFIRSLKTDAQGRFELEGIPRGRYVAVSWPDGYTEASVEFDVMPGRTTEIVLVPKPGGATVIGAFLDADGAPITRLGVNVNSPLRYGERPSGSGFGVDSQGRLRATGVSPGRRVAIAWDVGYLRYFDVAADAATVDLGTFRLPRHEGPGSIEGQVIDDGGTPLVGTRVCIGLSGSRESWCRFVTTDGGGQYRFDGVEPGRYAIWHEPSTPTNFVLEIPPEEIAVGAGVTRHDLKLPRP